MEWNETLKHRYSVITQIIKIEQRYRKQYVSGVGPDVVVKDISTGWWIVTAAPEPYAVCVGDEKPEFEVGQEIKLILEI